MGVYFIHKHEIGLVYNGPEEGGQYFTAGTPDENWEPFNTIPFPDEDTAYALCRALNKHEHLRAKEEEDYEFSSVLAYKSRHYQYSVEETPIMEDFPKVRPHYE